MSRVDLDNQSTTPSNHCFKCKYWKRATAGTLFVPSTFGHCSAGYCKQQAQQQKKLH